jgi:hypothetical protein
VGILNFFSKPEAVLQALPRGSFTVDTAGNILVSTLPQSISGETVRDIARVVLGAFQTSRQTSLIAREIIIRYANLKLTARELQGGAIIFLSPQNITGPVP